MMLWFVLALMTAAAVFSVLWPLSRRTPLRAGSDIAVYRDQLEEIERDRATGLIAEREAEAARVEVSRRLIAAAETSAPAPAGGALWRRRALALAALVLLPLGAASLYLTLGSPELPSQPLSARLQAPPEHRTLVELVGRVEAHLEQNPNDGHGWEVLAPVYMRMGRYDDAVRARRNVLRLLGPTAEREADLGEALTGVANGVVTAEARESFERAVGLNPEDVRARYFTGLAAEQDGRPQVAADIWHKLLASAPADASWTDLVRDSLARVEPGTAPSPGPSAADVASAAGLSPDQQNEMARAMVARLAERLKQDGSDVEGWLRLVRSYLVLGEQDKAFAADVDARRALAGDPAKLRQFDEISKTLARADTEGQRRQQDQPAPQSGPSAEDVAAAGSLSPEQRSEMVRGMVARLAERLKQDGSDVEGWQRLLRAYMVLGDKVKARAAAADARRALASDPDKLRRIEEVIRGFGLQG